MHQKPRKNRLQAAKQNLITILYVNSVTELGGAEWSLFELVKHLNREMFTPSLLTSSEGPLAEHFRSINVPVYFSGFPFFSRRKPWIYWSSIWKIIRLIRTERINLIHINCDRAVPHLVLAGRLTHTPVLCHIHDMTRAWFLPRYVRYLNQSDLIIADSQATARYCQTAGMKAEKINVIYECFEMERFTRVKLEERTALRTAWCLEPENVAIGLVGHILRYKGHEEFIRAAAIVNETFPNAHFIIIGDDSMSNDSTFLPYLHQLAADLGITSKIHFTGSRSDIPQVMAALDIVVAPSWTEAFGRVVVEALATSRPVVASNIGGIPEILKDSVTGYLIPPKSPNDLAQAILQLSQNPELRHIMGTLGPASAKRFDVGAHTRLFENTYEAILKRQTEILPRVPFGEPTWLNSETT